MMNINYEYYRIFYYVAKYRNFTQAAAALMNNQPNITRTIRKLRGELELYVVRTLKSRRNVNAGRRKNYTRISELPSSRLRWGKRFLSMDRTLQSGVLSIGASEVALRCFLLPVLKEYHRLYPGVRLRISNQPTPQPISALRSGAGRYGRRDDPYGRYKAAEGAKH